MTSCQFFWKIRFLRVDWSMMSNKLFAIDTESQLHHLL